MHCIQTSKERQNRMGYSESPEFLPAFYFLEEVAAIEVT